MSGLDVAAIGSEGFGSGTTARVPNRRRTGLSGTLMWACLAICILAPLPLGSNRPLFWTITAIVVGLVAAFYALSMRGLREDFRFGFATLRAPMILFALLLGFLLIQLLPLGSLMGGVAGLVPPAISIAPGATVLMVLKVATYGLFFFLIVQVAADGQRRRRMLDALLIAIVAYALFGIASLQFGDTILGFEKWGYRGSATGTFVNRNSFATFLAFGTILAFTQILHLVVEWLEERAAGNEPRLPISPILLYGLAFAATFAVLIATQSRMGFAVGLAGVVAVALFAAIRTHRSGAALLPYVLLAMLAGALALLAYGGGLLERFGAIEESGAERMDLYAQIVDLIAMRPLTGFGGGSFELAYPLVHAAPVSPGLVWDKAHNTYLALWSELGLVFGSIPILIVALLAARLLASLAARQGSWRAQAAALGVIVAGALHSAVDFSLEIQANTLLFLAVLGIGWAASMPSRQSRSDGGRRG